MSEEPSQGRRVGGRQAKQVVLQNEEPPQRTEVWVEGRLYWWF